MDKMDRQAQAERFKELRRVGPKSGNTLRGIKYALLIGGGITLLLGFLYPIAIDPMINTQKFKEKQEAARQGLKLR